LLDVVAQRVLVRIGEVFDPYVRGWQSTSARELLHEVRVRIDAVFRPNRFPSSAALWRIAG